MVARAAAAQKKFALFSQQQVDAIVESCAAAAVAAGEFRWRAWLSKRPVSATYPIKSCEEPAWPR